MPSGLPTLSPHPKGVEVIAPPQSPGHPRPEIGPVVTGVQSQKVGQLRVTAAIGLGSPKLELIGTTPEPVGAPSWAQPQVGLHEDP